MLFCIPFLIKILVQLGPNSIENLHGDPSALRYFADFIRITTRAYFDTLTLIWSYVRADQCMQARKMDVNVYLTGPKSLISCM